MMLCSVLSVVCGACGKTHEYSYLLMFGLIYENWSVVVEKLRRLYLEPRPISVLLNLV